MSRPAERGKAMLPPGEAELLRALLVIWSGASPGHVVQELRPVTAARDWTRYYHPLTAPDVDVSRWPNLVVAIREAAASYPSHTAFTLALPNGSQGGLSYADVDRLSDQFAVYLREVAGFKAGDRIALQMPNCLAYPVAVFGILKAGLVMVNTNPLYTVPEMVHQFADSGAVGLVAIDLFAPKVQEALPKDRKSTRL